MYRNAGFRQQLVQRHQLLTNVINEKVRAQLIEMEAEKAAVEDERDILAAKMEDLERGKGQLSIRMTDYDAFKVGENIAVSPGKRLRSWNT